MGQFEVVIGLEVHAQLATQSKLFCPCPAKPKVGLNVSEVQSNYATCPVCAGHPGTLPVLNEKAIEFAIKAGLATHCKINLRNVFSRKNYFYPDSPKGYQISQYDLPICEKGWLEIKDGNSLRRITIERIHMEEDAGKNVHMSGYSLVNLNRAGVPLIEIVSAPELRSSQEASEYLKNLHSMITFLGVCDGNMQEGNFRCDANVSIMPKGSKTLGTRAEIKNLNSFKFLEHAIEFEVERQTEILLSGGKVVQETRGYDSDKGITVSMRSKEDAHDYRYFPEPDLIPVVIDESLLKKIEDELPELPFQKKARYKTEFGLSDQDCEILTSDREIAHFFESIMSDFKFRKLEFPIEELAKKATNFMTGEILRLLNEKSLKILESKILPGHLCDVVLAFQSKKISSTAAKLVIMLAFESGRTVSEIITTEGLEQVADSGVLDQAIDEILALNPSQVAEFKAGKEKVMGFFVGQVMKKTGGKADPTLLQELVKKKLQS